jgi:transposase-like protein
LLAFEIVNVRLLRSHLHWLLYRRHRWIPTFEDVHSRQEKRYKCGVCQQTFSASKGTWLYRLRTESEQVMLVITLLVYGCPVQAIVKAFGFDERTVRGWWQRAGEQCRRVHEQRVERQAFDLQQVQADEIKAKVQGGSVWMAMAMMVPTRLWLGGVISPRRDLALISGLVAKVHRTAQRRPLLLAVDGLASYVSAFRRTFRSPLPRQGQPGRPPLVPWPALCIVQVVKQRTTAGLEIVRRIVQGSALLVTQLLHDLQGGGGINTAYIERLNATFRQRLACLARRTRYLVQQQATLLAGMYVVGAFYNFCDVHESLRLWLPKGHRRWLQRTPAMAANLTDHCWTPTELLMYKVPPPPWTPPPHPGRRSKQTLQLIARWCS